MGWDDELLEATKLMERVKRKFVGIEREPKYFEIACRRIGDALKQPNLLFEEQLFGEGKATWQPLL